MPLSAAKQAAPVMLICGEDEFAVKQRAKQIYHQWTEELGGMDHEILDGSVANTSEALKVLTRLREGLQTLPFFGTGKVIWLQNCNFLGDERAASTQAVSESLAELAQDLKDFAWHSGSEAQAANVRLLISAGKVDKRKLFYKTLDKLGTVESFAGWSADERDWADRAEVWARKAVHSRQKEISDEALAELVSRVGPNSRQLDTEVEKLSLYVGGRPKIDLDDVSAICTRNKTARAFALGDALGDRDLPRLLARLDEELWEVKLDPQKSEIGLLYGLISKVRAMLLLKEMVREGWIKSEMDYGRFKGQLERVPADQLPQDRRFNPLAINAYVLFKALPQIKKYTEDELVRAMELLLKCNQQLVSSGLDESLVLQQTLVQIISNAEGAAGQPGRKATQR
ncbi:MAG TPA: DNA polymerase III subunit delta [Verrucomicrobiae bacterium]|nr:DNA polymerase III subunit delta [Verrucomicrobiae bacterium]